MFSLLALLSFAFWRYFIFQEDLKVDKPFTKGYSVENLELRITNDEGEMSAKFISPNLIRYTDSPEVEISKPKFWTYNLGDKQWLITSNSAKYNTKTNKVVLNEELMAKTINANTPTSFEADNLLVDLNTKLATTRDGILLKQQLLNMQGQVAKIDLNKQILEVNKNVKAVYKSPK